MSTNKKIDNHLRQTFLGLAGTNDENSATIDKRLNEGLEKMTAQLIKANHASLENSQRLQYTLGELTNDNQAKLTAKSLDSNIRAALETNGLFKNQRFNPLNPGSDNTPRMGRK